jgi:predicted DsbA family dithiol-disulfide isomerase
VAREARIQGTPGFVLYNRDSGAAGKLVGAHPYENFADAIDRVKQA